MRVWGSNGVTMNDLGALMIALNISLDFVSDLVISDNPFSWEYHTRRYASTQEAINCLTDSSLLTT